MNRDLFAHEALRQIPKILTLQDRNPHSPTYGCFDRNFWQYKIIDFPSGMSQEFVWPLALVYDLPLPQNPYYQQPAVKAWAEAGILYAAGSAHADGSCDDYFPFERAGGAAAFSLLACLEAYRRLGLARPELLRFFKLRANWLAHHHESGRLTNHQALIVLCLLRAGALLQTNEWQGAISERLSRVFSWQNAEGWFQEYEGCDPGYHTLTVSCLAQIDQLNQTLTQQGQLALGVIDAPRLRQAIADAVHLAAHFVHPDGSYGGEYTSRNTYNFFPHGFELAGHWLPEALSVTDRFAKGLEKGLGACYADDHIVGHHTWNYLLTWEDAVITRPPTKLPPSGSLCERIHLQNAQLLIDQRADTKLYLALNKGGTFKFFRENRLVLSDTQFSLQVRQGRKLKNAVGHLVGPCKVQIEADQITLRGSLGWAKQKQMTTVNLLILRAVMFTVGRFFPDLIRKLLQKVLITGKQLAPFEFERQFLWQAGTWQVVDELRSPNWSQVVSAGIAADQTSIYVVMSRTFQPGQLQPWLDLTAQVQQLKPGEPLRWVRSL